MKNNSFDRSRLEIIQKKTLQKYEKKKNISGRKASNKHAEEVKKGAYTF